MFSSLSTTMDVGTGSQDDILATQTSQLGNPESGLCREQKHGPIASPYPGGRIRGRQQSLYLFPIEEFDRPTFVTFRWHCEYSLA